MVGVLGLVFKVMPFLSPVQSAAVIAVIPILPAIVHTCFIKRMTRMKKKTAKMILTSIFTLLLMVALGVTIVIITMESGEHSSDKIDSIVWSIASVICISLRMIDTYASTGFKEPTDGSKQKSTIKGAAITNFISSSLRVALGSVLVVFYICPGIRGLDDTFSQFMDMEGNSINHINLESSISNCTISNVTTTAPVSSNSTTVSMTTTGCPVETYRYTVWLPWDVLPSFLVHFFTAFLVYHCAITACFLRMQVACFTVPLWAASPVYVVIMIASSKANSSWVLKLFYGERHDYENYEFIFLAAFLLGWIAQMWISRHILKEPPERLTFKRKYV